MESSQPQPLNQVRPIAKTNQSNSTASALGSYYTTTTRYLADKNVLIITLVLLLVLSLLGINLLTLLGDGIQYIINWIGPYIMSFFFKVSDTTGAVLNKTADVVADTTKTGVDIADGSVHSIGNLLRNSNNINPNLGQNVVLDNVVNLGVSKTNIPVPPLNPNVAASVIPTANIIQVPVPVPTPVPIPIPTPIKAPTPAPAPAPAPAPIDLDQILNSAKAQANKAYSEPRSDSTNNPIQNPISSNKSKWCLVGEYNGKRSCISVTDENKCMSGQLFPSEARCLK